MAENKTTPDLGIPEVPPAAETAPAPAEENIVPTTTKAETPAATTSPKTKKSPMYMIKKFLAKFKKGEKVEPVAA